jgi:hypothetical protein
MSVATAAQRSVPCGKVTTPVLILSIVLVALALVPGSQATLPVEAVFEEVSGDQVRMHKSNSTLAQWNAIIAERVSGLVTRYCPHLATDLGLFAAEHGAAFGITNETHPGFDPYDVAQRVLMTLEAVDGFPVVSKAIDSCRQSVSHEHRTTSKRQHALWILVCLGETEDKERDTLSGNEVFLRWTAHVNAKAAIDALTQMLKCMRQMSDLASYHAEMEYRADGLRKAHAAGQLSQERLDAVLARTRLPRRVDLQRALIHAKNVTLHAAAG